MEATQRSLDPSDATPGNITGGRPWTALLLLAVCWAISGPVFGQTVIEIDRFGAGNSYRPGGPVAVRVIVTSDLDEPTPGLVQWEVPNPDRDVTANLRRIAVPARGGTAVTWLVADLPSRSDPGSITEEPWTFRLFAYEDGRRTREIASARIDPSLTQPRTVAQDEGMAMVIGINGAGLGGYGPIPGFPNRPGLNEQMVVVPRVRPGELPDHWAGLADYELIVWAANDPAYYPSIISNKPSTENAVRRWMERGGHLVILLPEVGDPWRIGRDETVFGDLLRDVQAIRETGYPLNDALPALSDRGGLRSMNARFNLTRFDPKTLPPAWRPLAGFRPYRPSFDESNVEVPNGSSEAERRLRIDDARDAWEARRPDPVIYAIRRDVGQGTLDLVGIDVSNPDLQLQQTSLLPVTSVFWNPILGRRGYTASPVVLNDLKKDNQLTIPSNTRDLANGSLVSPAIALSAAAATGVLLGLVIFSTYWLVAGPLGYAILRRLDRRRFAWVAFVGSGVVFAAIAWSLGRIAIDRGEDLRHVTILRHVYAPPGQAGPPAPDWGLSWFSARLSGYGFASVELDDQQPGNVLSFFSPPPNGMDRGFLDANRYDVAFDSKSGYEVPARSTSAEFVADWLGGPRPIDGVWESTIKVDPNDPIRVTQSADGRLQVSGTLVNASGTVLSNVLVALTVSDRLQPPTVSPTEGVPPDVTANLPPNLGRFFSRADSMWAPGEAWNLGATQNGGTNLRSRGTGMLGTELDDRFEFQTNMGFDVLTPADRIRDLQKLSFFQMLPQPSILAARDGKGRNGRFQRRMARGMDMSRRLTEPNLVVLATAPETPNPIPVEIEGEDRPGTGLVLLQWIHPLPVDVERLVPERAERFDPTPGPRDQNDSDTNDGVAAAWR